MANAKKKTTKKTVTEKPTTATKKPATKNAEPAAATPNATKPKHPLPSVESRIAYLQRQQPKTQAEIDLLAAQIQNEKARRDVNLARWEEQGDEDAYGMEDAESRATIDGLEWRLLLARKKLAQLMEDEAWARKVLVDQKDEPTEKKPIVRYEKLYRQLWQWQKTREAEDEGNLPHSDPRNFEEVWRDVFEAAYPDAKDDEAKKASFKSGYYAWKRRQKKKRDK